jgi:uncharacterized protein
MATDLAPLRPPLVTKTSSIGIFVLIAFGWTWAFELLGRGRIDPPYRLEDIGALLLLASFGPLVGALVVVVREHGRAGVRLLMRRFMPVRGHWWAWLMAAYVLVPAAIVSLVIFSDGDVGRALREGALLVFVPVIGLFSILTGPLGEEFGWRGVLLPALLARTTPLVSALIVGLVWGVWHAPLWTFGDFVTGLAATTFVPLYLGSLVAMSVIMTVLHLRSTDSVAIAMFAHGVLNSVVLPFDALREAGVLTSPSAWPFTIAIVVTGLAVGFTHRRVLLRRAQ